jgi:hypothetical protein
MQSMMLERTPLKKRANNLITQGAYRSVCSIVALAMAAVFAFFAAHLQSPMLLLSLYTAMFYQRFRLLELKQTDFGEKHHNLWQDQALRTRPLIVVPEIDRLLWVPFGAEH